MEELRLRKVLTADFPFDDDQADTFWPALRIALQVALKQSTDEGWCVRLSWSRERDPNIRGAWA